MLKCHLKQPGRFKKNRILKKAWKAGCDFDGDSYIYHGTFYFVSANYVSKTIKQPLKDTGMPFFRRWFVNGSFSEVYIRFHSCYGKGGKYAIK